MEIPTEISFHGLPRSPSVEASIQRWVARLENLNGRIRSCHVFVEQPHRRQRSCSDFEVHVHLDVPGMETGSRNHHEDIYVAVADAFRAVRRQLLDGTEMRTGRGRQQLHV
ncbi:MAG: ribosome-associated translation inhibitor RaiA [Deltaproteobacteria bacterium]|nr:ribosome-associated translation inhibitor RaiA [Deltaproteobacteria bacterium]